MGDSNDFLEKMEKVDENGQNDDDNDHLLEESDSAEDNLSSEEKEEPKTLKDSIIPLAISLIQNCTFLGVVYYMGVKNYSIAWLIPPVLLKVILSQLPTVKKSATRKSQLASLSALYGEKKVLSSLLHDLPAWVYFPDFERAEWVNKILLQLWPNANKYARSLLKETIGPSIAAKLKGFRFEYVSLGQVPPRIGGVKVYEKTFIRDQIVMDIDFIYASDCDINFSVGGMKGGIKDFSIIGPLRVILKPLIRHIPLVGAVQVYFLNNPDLDYDLDGVAELLNTPGLNNIIKNTILTTIADMMVLPNKFVVTLSDEVKPEDIKMPQPEGVIRIHVPEAKDLMNKDNIGKSDPYTVITLGAQTFRTSIIQSNLNPVWDYWCEALGEVSQKLQLTVYDKDETRSDESLGRVSMDLQAVIDNGIVDEWLTLDEASHGMIHVRLFWYALSNNIADLDTVLEENRRLGVPGISSALLIVFIDSARNLPMRKKEEPNAFAIVSVGNFTRSTRIEERKLNPVWEKGFSIPVGNPNYDTLFVKVCDTKEKYEIGNYSYPLSLLLKTPNLSIRLQPFQLKNSGPKSKIVMSFKMHILKKGFKSQEIKSVELRRRKKAGLTTTDDMLKRTDSVTSATSHESNFSNFSVPTNIKPRYDSESSGASVPIITTSQDADMGILSESEISKKSADTFLSQTPSSSSGEYGRGRIHLTLRYNPERQKLYVTVHRVSNIPITDPSNIPDPYVKLYMLPGRSKDSKRRTNVVKDSCNPIYENTFEYVLCDTDLNFSQLEVKVCSQKGFLSGGSPTIGMKTVSFQSPDIPTIDGLSTWFDLEPEN